MKISINWLNECFKLNNLSATEIAEKLTLAGLEVESVNAVAGHFTGVIVGEVLSTKPHPNADRLTVCEVTIGQDHPLQIVCGAANVRPKLKVAVATVGAVLPDNFKIKPATLRGVESQGMLCSARELGLSDEHAGILELPVNAPIGSNLVDYLQLSDHVLDIAITPNRGDCLSVKGIARELAAIHHITFSSALALKTIPHSSETFPIVLSAPDLCPRYVGRVIKHINPDAATPIWMHERLRRSGIRSIHPIVDITNYVMLELGQPLHAFDLDLLQEGIQIRKARPEESIELLQGRVIALDTETLVIADSQKPQAIAGIMGGLGSSVTASTKNIFLESAFFSPDAIRATAVRYNLQSESSQRFERGVDYELQQQAIAYATQLIVEIVGGKPGQIQEEFSKPHLPVATKILMPSAEIPRLLGINIDEQTIEKIFESLQFNPKKKDNGWECLTPSHRFDLEQSCDLVEELARLEGFEKIPSAALQGTLDMPKISDQQNSLVRILQCLADRGFCQVMNYSFTDSVVQAKFFPKIKPIRLTNPITSEMDVMRVSLWPGLLKTLQYNLNRQQARTWIVESGYCYSSDANQQKEEVFTLAGLMSGQANDLQWGKPSRLVDFFDLKGEVTALLNLLGVKNISWEAIDHPMLHPRQSAAVMFNNRQIGVIGALHPQWVTTLDLSETPFLFELDEIILQRQLPAFQSISKFPAIRRDIAVVIDETITAQALIQSVKKNAGSALYATTIFDIYRGVGIEPGKKSVALELTFQDALKTLQEEEINPVIERIISALQGEFGAKLRT